MLRFLTAGESHGEALSVIIDGIPANLPLPLDKVNFWLAERQKGHGRGGRMKIEKDQAHVIGGLRNGRTLGSPVSILIHNKDWANWEKMMHAEHGSPAHMQSVALSRPRPGHADLAGSLKYAQTDLRNILERASARETTSRTAAGAVAIALLEQFGVQITAHVVQIGPLQLKARPSFASIAKDAPLSDVRCVDPALSKRMVALIDKAKKNGDSLGGTFEVRVKGLPIGLGSHVQWDRKLDGRLAQALISIQSVKAVQVGLGVDYASHFGSEVHDEIFWRAGAYGHKSNNAGGIEGGMSNGEELVLRASMKPIPTLMKPLGTVDMKTKEPIKAKYERSDTCSVPAAAVVGCAVVAFELADAFLEKFGGDSLEECKAHLKSSLALQKRR
ncbi:MAG: chorismate synthase [candidate division FCPU426 bacterium]